MHQHADAGFYDRAIFLLLDGARADVFAELLAAGDLPNVARHLVERGRFVTATTVFPSVTGVAYAPYVTGCFPARTNLPGVRWMDRRLYARRKFSPSRFRNYVGPGHFMMNRDLSREVKTLFELLRPSSNIFGTVSRGTKMHRNAFLLKRIPWSLHFMLTGDWAPIDEQANAMLLRAAQRRRERFTFHTTLQVDEHSHHDGPFSPRAREGYRSFDRAVGALAARLKARGTFERTLLVLGSDHGHSEVSHHFDLESFFRKRGLRTLHPTKTLPHWFDCDVAVMVGGNGMGHVYLRGAGWDAEETGEERLASLPGVVDDLLAEEAVDLCAWRGAGGWVEVRSRRGAARMRLGDDVEYLLAGSDPFGYGPMPARLSTPSALQLTKDTDYPDGIVQLSQIFRAPRCGDLIVSARPGWDLRLKEHHRALRSGHGSLHREHMNVPFALSHKFEGDAVRSADAFPTILQLVGERIPDDIDGRCLV